MVKLRNNYSTKGIYFCNYRKSNQYRAHLDYRDHTGKHIHKHIGYYSSLIEAYEARKKYVKKFRRYLSVCKKCGIQLKTRYHTVEYCSKCYHRHWYYELGGKELKKMYRKNGKA